MDVVLSKHGVPIRLPEERWEHIEREHDDLRGRKSDVLQTVESPERILAGAAGELLAVAGLDKGKWLVVVYRELSTTDGFVITAYATTRRGQFEQRRTLWP